MPGWMGDILRVDLTSGIIREEQPDPEVLKDYIGGRGLGIYYLTHEVDPTIDPLSPDNKIFMFTGPLTGTRAPTGARYMVMTKSPLTGALTCSNSGGKWPTELKRCGLDGLIFEGKANEPVYLWIENGHAELRPAGHLWGLDSHQTDEAVKAETSPNARVASIGPAAEAGVLFASIMNDLDRAAGRSGVGTVMGSKNLKAIAVMGDQPVALYDEQAFKQAVKTTLSRFKNETKGNPPVLRTHGTPYVVMVSNSFGALPTKNWQQGSFEDWAKIHGEHLTEKYLVKNKACHSCPIGCGRVTKVSEPGFEGEGEGPEYETVYALGSNCMVSNLAAVIKANYICNELGMDTITMGATIACAMDLYDRGHIPESDIGFPLKWGDDRALVELTRQTGCNEGFGKLLGLGSKRLAAHYGHPELAVHSKGQEPPGYECRAEQGMGLAYATSPIGASHMRGDPAYAELFGTPVKLDPLTWKDKPYYVMRCQNLSTVVDSAGLCVFYAARYLTSPDLEGHPVGIMDLLNGATGADYSLEELEKAGERIFNAERIWLNRAGFDRKQDALPDKLTKNPAPLGPAKGMVLHLDEMLDDYYGHRGWTRDGVVSDAKKRELGL